MKLKSLLITLSILLYSQVFALTIINNTKYDLGLGIKIEQNEIVFGEILANASTIVSINEILREKNKVYLCNKENLKYSSVEIKASRLTDKSKIEFIEGENAIIINHYESDDIDSSLITSNLIPYEHLGLNQSDIQSDNKDKLYSDELTKFLNLTSQLDEEEQTSKKSMSDDFNSKNSIGSDQTDSTSDKKEPQKDDNQTTKNSEPNQTNSLSDKNNSTPKYPSKDQKNSNPEKKKSWSTLLNSKKAKGLLIFSSIVGLASYGFYKHFKIRKDQKK